VARRRSQWRKYQDKLDPKRLVFVDETGAKTNMTRTHGRCTRGQRLVAKVPHGRWKTLTFMAALRVNQIASPFVIDRPTNRRNFLAYVQQVLVPALPPGDIVIMDNLRSHKSPAVRQASARQAPSCSSCRRTAPTSIRSNRCSPSSRLCSAKPQNAPWKPPGNGSARCSTRSAHRNAPTTSPIRAMPPFQAKANML
jgi:hypothetical protein